MMSERCNMDNREQHTNKDDIENMDKKYSIAVAGTGYVGFSMAVLLSQHHHVVAVDIVPEKVNLINEKKSPIVDEYIEKYLREKELDLVATLDGTSAYSQADFVVIAAPTIMTVTVIILIVVLLRL